MQNRRRIGQTGSFDHHPVEMADAVTGETPGDVFEGLGQIAAHRTANAAAFHCRHQRFIAVRNQQMIQADSAEFVDDHQRAVESRLPHPMIQQRGFAAAEKSGQQQNRDRLVLCGGHCYCELA